MLVLKRKVGQRIMLGDEITLLVVKIKADQVKLGIEAPDDVPVHREEVYERIKTAAW